MSTGYIISEDELARLIREAERIKDEREKKLERNNQSGGGWTSEAQGRPHVTPRQTPELDVGELDIDEETRFKMQFVGDSTGYYLLLQLKAVDKLLEDAKNGIPLPPGFTPKYLRQYKIHLMKDSTGVGADGRPFSNAQQIKTALMQMGNRVVLTQEQALKLLKGKFPPTSTPTPTVTPTTTVTPTPPATPSPENPAPRSPLSSSSSDSMINKIATFDNNKLNKLLQFIQSSMTETPATRNLQEGIRQLKNAKAVQPTKRPKPSYVKNKLEKMKQVLREMQDEERMEAYMKRIGSASTIDDKKKKKLPKGRVHDELKRRKRKRRSRNSWTLARL